MGNVLFGLAWVINQALTVYTWILIIAVLLSWVQPDPYNPIVRFLRAVTEPVLYWVRRKLPFLVVGGMDLTPIVVIFAIQFLKFAVVNNLFGLAFSMGAMG